VYAAVFSPDGSYLATSGADERVVLTPLGGTRAARTLPGSDYCCPLAFSPNGKYLARGGDDVAVWALADPAPGPAFTAAVTLAAKAVAFSPDGRVLAATGFNDALRRWAVPSGRPLPGGWGGPPDESDENQTSTGCLSYAPGGAVLATASAVRLKRGNGSVIFLWDAKTGAPRGQLRYEGTYADPEAVVFSPDGRLLAGTYGPYVRLFDVATEKEVARSKPGSSHNLRGLAISPDGRRLVTVSNDRKVRVWDVPTLTEVAGYEWKIGKLGAVAVAPDGMRMAAGGESGRVVVWDVDS
jgi:hypothetical protein